MVLNVPSQSRLTGFNVEKATPSVATPELCLEEVVPMDCGSTLSARDRTGLPASNQVTSRAKASGNRPIGAMPSAVL